MQKVTGKEIRPVQVRQNDKPGQSERNGELNIYRPQIQKTEGNGQKPVPQKVVKIQDVRPVKEGDSGNEPLHANPASSTQKENAPVPQDHNANTPNERSQDQPRDANPNIGKDQQPAQPQTHPDQSKHKSAGEQKRKKPK